MHIDKKLLPALSLVLLTSCVIDYGDEGKDVIIETNTDHDKDDTDSDSPVTTKKLW